VDLHASESKWAVEMWIYPPEEYLSSRLIFINLMKVINKHQGDLDDALTHPSPASKSSMMGWSTSTSLNFLLRQFIS